MGGMDGKRIKILTPGTPYPYGYHKKIDIIGNNSNMFITGTDRSVWRYDLSLDNEVEIINPEIGYEIVGIYPTNEKLWAVSWRGDEQPSILVFNFDGGLERQIKIYSKEKL